MYKYFKKIGSTKNISSWESKELSNIVIKAPDNTLAPKLTYSGKRMYVQFNGNCLKEDKITVNHGKIVHFVFTLLMI